MYPSSIVQIVKAKLESLRHIPFIIGLMVLLLNDFYFKAEYSNWLTGKLSDFSGLFVFVLFWEALFPKKKLAIYWSTALCFILWKSSYTQGFIHLFSQCIYPINRVVDGTDLMALAVLPLAYYYKPIHRFKLKLNPLLLGLVAIFSFCATSSYGPYLKFDKPQYLLFKPEVVDVLNKGYIGQYEIHHQGEFVLVDVKELILDKEPPIYDDYHKAQVLKDLDLRLLKNATGSSYPSKEVLSKFLPLRDSLSVNGNHVILFELDGFTEHLNFSRTRLHGLYKRVSEDGILRINGYYNHGVEDSVWTYYDETGAINSETYFENGERIKISGFQEFDTNIELKTRKILVEEKQKVVCILFAILLILIFKITLNFKRLKHKEVLFIPHIIKITGILVLPLVCLALGDLFLAFIPDTASFSTLESLVKLIWVYIVYTPIFVGLFYLVKLKDRIEMVYYILLLSVLLVLIQEWNYLNLLLP